jgi:hypothetical protein
MIQLLAVEDVTFGSDLDNGLRRRREAGVVSGDDEGHVYGEPSITRADGCRGNWDGGRRPRFDLWRFDAEASDF